ncbi:uncharacterized protein LOC119071067 [Bradysia coprophila]|uniref:uncharacterized protein LOC119071067 n=1 Tax=Bradysia coprophila TaxID=38358 RepID=UPI00187DC7A6|nr:uncharacterized protein LOC119071067 [Bradysia coprophila]
MDKRLYRSDCCYTMSFLNYCYEGNIDGIKAVLKNAKTSRERQQILQSRDNHYWTGLHHAVRTDNVDCVKYLLTLKGLSTIAETFEGETALQIACSFPDTSLEIVTALLEANPDLVNFVNKEEVDPLKCAINQKRLDIVKVLVAHGCPVNNRDLDGDTALHIAAMETQLDIIRFLLYETECDPTLRNDMGQFACDLLFVKLLNRIRRGPLQQDQLDCIEELANLTFNTYAEEKEEMDGIHEMVFFCYHHNEPNCKLYTTLARTFYVPPSKQYFVDKILASGTYGYHCLILGLLKDVNKIEHFERLASLTVESDGERESIWSNFLVELYTLFLADESFYLEYVSEFMSAGWNFEEQCQHYTQFEPLCQYIKKSPKSFDPQKFFTFLKTLIPHGFNLKMFMSDRQVAVMSLEMLAAFVALVNTILPEGYVRNRCHFPGILDQPVNGLTTLKKLCRLQVRYYFFTQFSHYDALKALYSLNLPPHILQFVCYNFANFEF